MPFTGTVTLSTNQRVSDYYGHLAVSRYYVHAWTLTCECACTPCVCEGSPLSVQQCTV